MESALTQGEFVVGEFIRVESVKKTGPRGEFVRERVKLLVDGEFPRSVEYPEGKLPLIVQQAQRGDVLTLPVFVKAVGDRVYWSGVTR